MGWGGMVTSMYLAYIRGCYAVATSPVLFLLYGGFGTEKIATYLAMIG